MPKQQTENPEKKTEVSSTLLWSIIHGEQHPQIPQTLKISDLMPLVEALFPGINYYSTSGFFQVMNQCLIPVLRKRYPELIEADVDEVPNTIISIGPALASNGYEWQTSQEWREKFNNLFLTEDT